MQAVQLIGEIGNQAADIARTQGECYTDELTRTTNVSASLSLSKTIETVTNNVRWVDVEILVTKVLI